MNNQFEILSIEILLEEYEILDENEATANGFLSWITDSGLFQWFKKIIIGASHKTGKAFTSGAEGKVTEEFLKKIGDAQKNLGNMIGSIDNGALNSDQIKTALSSAKTLGNTTLTASHLKDAVKATKASYNYTTDEAGKVIETSGLKISDEISKQLDQTREGIIKYLPESVRNYLRDHGNITTGVAAAAGILGLIYLYKKFIRNPNKKLDRQTALYAQKLNNINPNQLSQSQLNGKIL